LATEVIRIAKTMRYLPPVSQECSREYPDFILCGVAAAVRIGDLGLNPFREITVNKSIWAEVKFIPVVANDQVTANSFR
jgi:hypothetical protein